MKTEEKLPHRALVQGGGGFDLRELAAGGEKRIEELAIELGHRYDGMPAHEVATLAALWVQYLFSIGVPIDLFIALSTDRVGHLLRDRVARGVNDEHTHELGRAVSLGFMLEQLRDRLDGLGAARLFTAIGELDSPAILELLETAEALSAKKCMRSKAHCAVCEAEKRRRRIS